MSRDKIVQVALSWENTPYHHQAGIKGVGVDCAYLIGHVAKECGFIPEFKIEPYSIEWHWHSREEKMCEIVESFGAKSIEIEDIMPGDILAFQYGRVCSHLGIYLGENRFIHANIKIGRVNVNTLAGDFKERLRKAYQFPNI